MKNTMYMTFLRLLTHTKKLYTYITRYIIILFEMSPWLLSSRILPLFILKYPKTYVVGKVRGRPGEKFDNCATPLDYEFLSLHESF